MTGPPGHARLTHAGRQRPLAAHVLQLSPCGHLLGEQRGLDAVEETFQPADQLRLGDPQFGIRWHLVLGEGQRQALQLITEFGGQAVFELADRGGVDFTQPAATLERRVRAFNPWPGTWFEWNGTLLKVLHARDSAEKSPGAGLRFIFEGYPAIGTGAGMLILEEIQPAGKKSMPGKAFLAGARGWNNHE